MISNVYPDPLRTISMQDLPRYNYIHLYASRYRVPLALQGFLSEFDASPRPVVAQ